jgi:hypothetical protein
MRGMNIMPWLDAGKNTGTVGANSDTAIATRSIACRITNEAAFDNNETTATMGVVFGDAFGGYSLIGKISTFRNSIGWLSD